jgi:glutamate synthase domain-containing protein 2
LPISRTEHDLIVKKHAERIHHGLEVLPSLRYGIPGGLGNKRWTSDLIFATYQQATTGEPPIGLEYKVGKSGGGFDRLDFKTIANVNTMVDEDYDLSLNLNRRAFGPDIKISIPIYGGGMSFGSVSLNFMLARAMAAKRLNTFTCTGEGGYPPELMKFKDYVITQVATGMFGVREETIQWAPIVEIKYAQGAKPGLGGHLLGDKATRSWRRCARASPG